MRPMIVEHKVLCFMNTLFLVEHRYDRYERKEWALLWENATSYLEMLDVCGL